MKSVKIAVALLVALPVLTYARRPERLVVGPLGKDAYLVSTLQTVRPAGTVITFNGRPVDQALDSSRNRLYVKEAQHLIVIDLTTARVIQELPFPSGTGASMHGIALTPQGEKIWITTAGNSLLEATIDDGGVVRWGRSISLPGKEGKGNADGCGITLFSGARRAAVCLSMANGLATIDLQKGKVETVIPTGVAPYDVILSPDEKTAYVSDWGGHIPAGTTDATAMSAGTATLVDSRGIANDGCVSVVDMMSNREVKTIPTGLHPCSMAMSHSGDKLYVANANSDTISVLEPTTGKVDETISVHPSRDLPFGSAPNAVAITPDGDSLLVANAGNNCVVKIELKQRVGSQSHISGLIPTGWYPGAVLCWGNRLVTASIKGLGSRYPTTDIPADGYSVRQPMGCVSIVEMPDTSRLREYTKQVIIDSRIRQSMVTTNRENPPGSDGTGPKSTTPGIPAKIKHVVYIIKENRTYDQLFGDIKSGNGDPRLVMYGEEITPNHHALANNFVLLDNYYCNGSISADGHSWATEGNCTDHLEKSFGGFVRSYTFGDDPLTYSSSGFLWDRVISAGLSFRNYGEMDYAGVIGHNGFKEIYSDYKSHAGKIAFTHNVGIANLRAHTMTEYPGWNLSIPDVVRADIFLKDLRRSSAEDTLAALTILYLPDDHTSGASPGARTPRAHVAGNDLALGQIVEGISHSKYWPETCIFVNEDDPQDGYDHVDGHRSLCLVISPYTRRHTTVSAAYNQTSVLHTIESMLGLKPMNQFDAAAPIMSACFIGKPYYAAYNCVPNRIPLDEMNPRVGQLSGLERTYAARSAAMDWSRPDAADEEGLNRILWYMAKAEPAKLRISANAASGADRD